MDNKESIATPMTIWAYLNRFEIRVSLLYGIFALLWIIFSDVLLSLLAVGSVFVANSMVKGTGFVLITTLGLFAVLSHEERKRRIARTALRHSEERYRHIVETTSEGIWLINTNSQTTFVNARMADMLGYKTEEMIGQPAQAFLPDSDSSDYASLDAIRYGTKEQFGCKLRRRDSTEFWGIIKSNPLTDDSGIRTGTLVMIIDVTEQKLAYEHRIEAERLRAELQQKQEVITLKERFTSMVTHEIRNPLATIVLAAETLTKFHEKLTPEQCLRKAEQIHHSAQGVTEMLEDFLSFNRNSAASSVLKLAPLNLERLCQDITDQVQPLHFQAVPRRIVFNATGSLQNVKMDEVLIRHILTNLLVNALKYSPAESVVQFALSAESDQAVFQIKDQGIGIPADDLPHLFDPFHRSKNARHIPGTGLGLAIVKECVDKHGGTITVESAENQGTTFTVRLPTGI